MNQKSPFAEIHQFIRDRTRSIRQDLTIQNIRNESSIQIHEYIARFHILSSHILCEEDPSVFDAFQNTEQLRKVLQTLQELYHDHGHKSCPNEPEFQSYYILTHLKDEDVYRRSLSMPSHIFNSPLVQLALDIVSSVRENNYIRFFKLLEHSKSASNSIVAYLQACISHSHFTYIRKQALVCMTQVYSTIKLSELKRLLRFDSIEESSSFLSQCSIDPKDIVSLNINASTISEASISTKRSYSLVQDILDTKYSYSDIIYLRIAQIESFEIVEQLYTSILYSIIKNLCQQQYKRYIAYSILESTIFSKIIEQVLDSIIRNQMKMQLIQIAYIEIVNNIQAQVINELIPSIIKQSQAKIFHLKWVLNHAILKWKHSFKEQKKLKLRSERRKKRKQQFRQFISELSEQGYDKCPSLIKLFSEYTFLDQVPTKKTFSNPTNSLLESLSKYNWEYVTTDKLDTIHPRDIITKKNILLDIRNTKYSKSELERIMTENEQLIQHGIIWFLSNDKIYSRCINDINNIDSLSNWSVVSIKYIWYVPVLNCIIKPIENKNANITIKLWNYMIQSSRSFILSHINDLESYILPEMDNIESAVMIKGIDHRNKSILIDLLLYMESRHQHIAILNDAYHYWLEKDFCPYCLSRTT